MSLDKNVSGRGLGETPDNWIIVFNSSDGLDYVGALYPLVFIVTIERALLVPITLLLGLGWILAGLFVAFFLSYSR